MKPAWYILKRGQELRNSLSGGTGKTLFGAATTVLDKRNNKRSIGIMIFLMEAVLASIFWLEDAPINTSNTIYVTYKLRKAYHILVRFGSAFAHFAFSLSSSSIFIFYFFFSVLINSNWYYSCMWLHCAGDKVTFHTIFMRPTTTLFRKKILKIGHTTLFTHLKIILL